jgi:opacity protein-like surface antigen
MRTPILVVAAMLASSSAIAQVARPAHQVGAGYSYGRYAVEETGVTFVETAVSFPKGYYVSFSERTRWRWDLTVESSHGWVTVRDTFTLPGGTVVLESPIEFWALVAGPSFSFRRGARASPFVRAMGGLSGWLVGCVQAGGGVDLRITDHVAVRAGADYRKLVVTGDDEPNLVAQVGINVGFGQ